MPWKETNTVDQRTEFVNRALREEMSFTALCREFGISTKTGYKWKQRFLDNGRSGMRDLSRKPRDSPTVVTADAACDVVLLKLEHPGWGPSKVHDVYMSSDKCRQALSLSSVKRILGRAGMVKPRRRRRSSEHCGRIAQPIVASAANHVWTVDFKGHWYTSCGKRVLPLTVCDSYSRCVLMAQIVPDAGTQTVMECFSRLFAEHGMPDIIRSDNGSPFASTSAPLGLSRLSAWWVAHGINLDRIEKGKPCQNGRHERMHLEIANDVEGRVPGGIPMQQAALDVWRQEYNHVRPHAGIGMQKPVDLYKPSERKFDPTPPQLEYPLGFERRRCLKDGSIKIHGQRMGISLAVSGWDLGLQPDGSNCYKVWFGNLCLGTLDLNTQKFKATEGRVYVLQETQYAISSN